MIDWQRKRAPEDVPTPVAVAVSDFCRRAKAAASPALVRDALSCLDESFDPRLRALADTEPTAVPLGPFAVVDVVTGAEQATAAQREHEGRYAEVRRGLKAHPPPLAEGLSSPPPPEPIEETPRTSERAVRAKKSKAERVKERIHPHRRAAGTPDETPPKAQVFATSFLPRRNLPAPRGRFTRIDPQRASFEVLLRPESAQLVGDLVAQAPHRFALLRTLDHGYTGRKGQALVVEEIITMLERHRRSRTLFIKERESVLAALSDARGGLGRASQALGLKGGEIEDLIDGLNLHREVEGLRERFSRDALDSKNLAWRLEILGRHRYLADLGIEAKFDVALARDLQRLLEDDDGGPSERAERLAKRAGLQPEPLKRALEHFGFA